MNRIQSILILFFLACWPNTTLNAQTCFVRKADASGLNISDQLPSLEQAACNLKNTFPEPFKSQFKVFEASYYLHNPVQKDATENLWNYLKQDVSDEAQFYLLIAREVTSTEIVSRFRVDVKFPTTGEFDCVTPAKITSLAQQVEAAINQKYTASGRIPYLYPSAEIEGMKVLQDEVFRFVDCCLCCQNRPEQRMMTDSCSQCTFSGDAMAGYLKSLGFAEYADAIVTVSSQTYSQPLESQHKVDVQIRGFSIPLTDELNAFLSSAQAVGTAKARVKVFNDTNCNEFENYAPLSHSGIYTEDIVVIDRDGKKRIFYKITEEISGNPVAAKKGDQAERPLPVLAIWLLKRAAMAGVGVITHIGSEWVFEKYFGDHPSWETAWEAVDLDFWETVNAGVEGLIGADQWKVQVFLGVFSQMADYVMETPYDQITISGVFSNALLGAFNGALNVFIDGGSEKLLGWLNKYGPDIAVKSFKKLSIQEYFFNFKSFRKTYINVVWVKADPLNRGWLIEEALQFSTYKGWTRVGQTNGPADFFHTTGWVSQVKSIAKVNPNIPTEWNNVKTQVTAACNQLISAVGNPPYTGSNARLVIVFPQSQAQYYNALKQKIVDHIKSTPTLWNNTSIQYMVNSDKIIIGTFLE
jgi:hypothetical protein